MESTSDRFFSGASAQFVRAALDLVSYPGGLRRAAAAAPPSVATLDWERIHDRLVAALREAIDGTAVPPPNEAVYRLLPD